MDLGIAGRVALVTGASAGLGRATAQALAEEGCHLVICSRTQGPLEQAAAELGTCGVQVLAVPGDAGAPHMPSLLVDRAVERFSRLDIVVPNLAGPPPVRALEVTSEQLDQAWAAGTRAPIALMLAALPVMRQQGWGRLCAIASIAVKQPIPDLALSGASRTGLWSWVKLAAPELIGEGITVNLACPDAHATDRAVALGYATEAQGDTADFGRIVAFLCSVPAGFISGSAVSVDAGAVRALL